MRFRIADAFLPSPEELMQGLALEATIEGSVVEFSDSGAQVRYFAVVEIVMARRVVVPANKLSPIAGHE